MIVLICLLAGIFSSIFANVLGFSDATSWQYWFASAPFLIASGVIVGMRG